MQERQWLKHATVVLVGSLLVGCGEAERSDRMDAGGPEKGDSTMTTMTMTITSPDFGEGQIIPTRHTGDGEDISPALAWSGVPDGTAELALICDDPDAPTPTPWVHWVIYKIPAEASGLPGAISTDQTVGTPPGARQGTNSWKTVGYRGPAPPPGHGVHHYHFRLYALDTPLDLPPGLDKDALLKAISGHVLAEGELVGTYRR